MNCEITNKDKEVKQPFGACDFCSKLFFENDYRLKQISNECSNIFKFEFCDIICLQAVEKDYDFVRIFEFEKTNKYKNLDSNELNIMKTLFTTFKSNVLDYSDENCIKYKRAYQLMKEYIDLNELSTIPEDKREYLEYIKNNKIFKIY